MHNNMRVLILCGLGWVLLGGSVKAQEVPAEVLAYPELILHNGKVVTMDDRGYNQSPGTVAQAIAIRGEKILALGSDQGVLRLAGPKTARIDLKGRTMIPGIVNAHTHIHNHAVSYWMSENPHVIEGVWRSFTVDGADFADLRKNIEVLLMEHVRHSRPGQWAFISTPTGIGGTGIGIGFIQQREMTLQDLDKLAPDNPVVVGAHPVYVINSAAKRAVKELYGFEPSEGLVDEAGFGSVVDLTRAIVVDSFFKDKIDKLAEIVKDGMEKQAALGTTAFSSHIIGLRFFDALAKLDREKQMPIRFGYTHYYGFQVNPDPSAFYMRFGDMAGMGSDFFWQSGVGLMSVDSGPPRMCTTMEAPEKIKVREWCKNAPGTKISEAIYTAISSRLRVAVGHAYADLAVDYFMDQLERAIREEPGITLDYIRSRRFTSDHCGFYPRPDQIPRIARLGMIISCRADYINRSYPSLEHYGMEYANWIAPTRSILEGGAKVVFESEVRVESGAGPTLFSYFLPFLNRKNRAGHVVAPEEAVDRVPLLKMATTWGSEFVLKEDEIGSLEKGKLADLLVLNKDYFTVPLEEIGDIYPLMTMVGGKVVVLRPEFAREISRDPVGPELRFRRRE